MPSAMTASAMRWRGNLHAACLRVGYTFRMAQRNPLGVRRPYRTDGAVTDGSRLRSLSRAIAVALAASGTPGLARAQTGDSVARAESLFREGRDAMRRHSYVEACDRFRESDSLDPSPGTRLNWAVCDKEVTHLVQALKHVRWALAHLGADDVRRPIASQLAAELERRLPRLTVRLAQPAGLDAKVYLDGEPLPMQGAEQTRAVDPGAHVILVEEPAHDTTNVVVSVEEGENAVRTVSAGTGQRDDDARPRSLPPPTRRSAARPVGYVLGASALANFAAAAVLGGLGLAEHGVVEQHCPAKQCDQVGFDAGQRARGFVNAGTLTFTLGVAGAIGAAVVLWPHKATTTASIVPLSGGAGFALGSAF